MQILSAKIAQAGNEGMVLFRKDLTPADIHILRKMHGYKSVRDIQLVGETQRSSSEERQRLYLTYKRESVESLFPSAAFPLPQTFEDEGDPDDALFSEDEGEQTERVTAASFNKPIMPVAAVPDEAMEAPAPAPVPASRPTPNSAPTSQAEKPKRRGNPEALAKARAAQAEKRAAIKAAHGA